MAIASQTKTPLIKTLALPDVINIAKSFKTSGKIALSPTNLSYLKIDDNYIHELFPLLGDERIQKPAYFGEGFVGAHITVIYPEENKIIDTKELHQEHDFTIKDIATAKLDTKTYYILLVESQSLLALRRRYQLPDLLCFKGYAIGFHITIGFINNAS